MKLTPNFTLEEMLVSETAARLGVDNSLPPDLLPVLIRTCQEMEKVRAILGGKIITVSSGYRCRELNRAIGGATASHHMTAEAVDFNCFGFGTPLEICRKLVDSDLVYDQLIQEFGNWVHIGFDAEPRRQNLTATKDGEGKTVYNHGHQ